MSERKTSSKRHRIFLVEDHPVTQQGLCVLLNQQKDFRVCGTAEDSRGAIKAISACEPDLAIVDLSLKDSSGLELVKDLKALHPELPMLVLSMHDETVFAERALRAGARGYLMKHQPVERVFIALRRILAGELYVSDKVSSGMLRRVSGHAIPGKRPATEVLSDREMEVLELIGEGKSSREIATGLGLSIKTVQTHREHLKEKLQLKDAPSLVRYAVQWLESERGMKQLKG